MRVQDSCFVADKAPVGTGCFAGFYMAFPLGFVVIFSASFHFSGAPRVFPTLHHWKTQNGPSCGIKVLTWTIATCVLKSKGITSHPLRLVAFCRKPQLHPPGEQLHISLLSVQQGIMLLPDQVMFRPRIPKLFKGSCHCSVLFFGCHFSSEWETICKTTWGKFGSFEFRRILNCFNCFCFQFRFLDILNSLNCHRVFPENLEFLLQNLNNKKSFQIQKKLGGGFKYFLYFHPYLGKWTKLTNIFQMGWNHLLENFQQKITCKNHGQGAWKVSQCFPHWDLVSLEMVPQWGQLGGCGLHAMGNW